MTMFRTKFSKELLSAYDNNYISSHVFISIFNMHNIF
jgi:hypothetical protein